MQVDAALLEADADALAAAAFANTCVFLPIYFYVTNTRPAF